MQSEQTGSQQAGSTNGRGPHSCDPGGGSSEVEELRATSRRQVMALDTLSEVVSNFQSAAKALKAENAELRADNERMRIQQLLGLQSNGRVEMGEPLEVVIAADVGAPCAARQVVARYLGDRVSPSVFDNAQLLISELVTNSVRHSGAGAGEPLTIRVGLAQAWCRVEVEDPGHDGVIAARPPDPVQGSGMGLNLVQMLSERWGLERAREGGTRVWAQLSRSAVGASDAHSGANGTRPFTAGRA
jgi:anti-sigma regulatory factor (Ser/Thr protein kinase)